MTAAPLRPPSEDRQVFLRPALAEMPDLVRRNHEDFAGLPVCLLGEPLQALRMEARSAWADGTDLVVATGHQPELYHPGVWIKNFLAARLARRLGAAVVNLVVDNDAAKHLDLAVPRPTAGGGAEVLRVPLVPGPVRAEAAYEEVPAPGRDFLEAVGASVRAACPVREMGEGFAAFWRLVLAAAGGAGTWAELITAARRRFEGEAGLDNRELLMSGVSESRPFRHLLLHVLGEAGRFAEAHNAALAAYRRAHRIRSRANPLPDLAVQDDTWELPYWAWRAGAPRGRLFARRTGTSLALVSGDNTVLAAPAEAWAGASSGAALLDEAAARGWKVRPRALSTTLFARLVLADVFIHGIGGAVYDEITDEIIRRFFAVEPPGFIVCSATVRLPLPAPGVTAEVVRAERRRLRDFTYNPERHLTAAERQADDVAEMIRRKRDLIGRPRGETPAARREVFLNIRALNASIHAGLAEREAALRREIERLEQNLAAKAVLTGREYAFCLFPVGMLPAFYGEALAERSG